MHFSIYIPNVNGASHEHLKTVGLGDLLQPGDVTPTTSEVMAHGPDGHHGLLYTWPGRDPIYRPGELTWKAAKADEAKGLAAGRFWWGFDPQQPPTSAELQRGQQLAGEILVLGGQLWQVPNVLLLPHRYVLDDAGREAKLTLPSHKAIYDRCMWAFNVMAEYFETRMLPEPECRQYVIEMLALNYRVFRDLVMDPDFDLGLLHAKIWWGVMNHTIDLDALKQIEADVKKKRAQVTAPTQPIPLS